MLLFFFYVLDPLTQVSGRHLSRGGVIVRGTPSLSFISLYIISYLLFRLDSSYLD